MIATTHDAPFLRRELRGATLVAARGVTGALVAVALLLFFRGIPGAFARASERAQLATAAGGGAPLLEPVNVLVTCVGIGAAMVWCSLAALIMWRRSRDLFGIVCVVGFVAIGTVLASPDQILIGGGSAFTRHADPWQELGRIVVWLLSASALFWVVSFPDGRFVPSWSFWLVVPWAVWGLLRIPFPEELSHTRYGLVGALLYSAFPVLALSSLVYRFARQSDTVQRQQLKWVIYGSVLIIAAWVTAVVVPAALGAPDGSNRTAVLYQTASRGWLAAATTLMPITVGLALFRLGFLNIDLLINRTVMYSVLTVVLIGAFVVIGTMAQRAYAAVAGEQSDFVRLAVAAPIALAFLPLRARMQAIADHFLSDRAVLTIVFLDLAGSTAKAHQVGDRAWRELLDRYRSVVRREIRRHGGREIDTAGDGFFMTFGSPGAAIRFAGHAVAAVRTVGLEARAGLHIGECEVHAGRVTGIGVHIGARIAAAAGAGEVLVSRTLRDLVAGSDIQLLDRGLHGLKGVPGRWHLYAIPPG